LVSFHLDASHIFWPGDPLAFDLSNLRDRVRVYELVFTEGNGDDIRFYVDPEEPAKLWPRVFLPTYVRRPWEA
jgi:hypothetical protein